jgi:hypothetical protein
MVERWYQPTPGLPHRGERYDKVQAGLGHQYHGSSSGMSSQSPYLKERES